MKFSFIDLEFKHLRKLFKMLMTIEQHLPASSGSGVTITLSCEIKKKKHINQLVWN